VIIMSAEAFVHDLLRVAPELKPILDEHLAANDTLLPHVFMADVARFAVAESANVSKRATILKLLNQLEKGLSTADEETRELILASFVENLMAETTALLVLKPLMGSNLRKAVHATYGQ
jgi:hypothetical protein